MSVYQDSWIKQGGMESSPSNVIWRICY